MDDLEPRGELRPAATATASPDETAPNRNRRWRWLVAALLALLVLSAVTVAVLAPRPADTAPTQVVPTTTDAPFPSETASDVVSYADHVALVTAVSEADAPPGSAPRRGTFPGGETAAFRQVTFRVDATLWSRPDAPVAPQRFTTLWWGWLGTGTSREPFIVQGAPVVFLGAQYVMPIAYDGSAFSAIQPFAVFRFNEGVVTPEEQETPLAQALTHASRNAVSTVFANAVPDPLAVRYRNLLPRARLAAVLAARR